MNNLEILNEQEVLGKHFRVYGTIDEPLFLAKDVAEWIEHTDLSRMVDLVDEGEKLKRTLYVSGQNSSKSNICSLHRITQFIQDFNNLATFILFKYVP